MPEQQTELVDTGSTVTKDVQMIAYDSDLDFPNLDDWATEMSGEPVNERKTEVDEKVEISLDLGQGPIKFTRGWHRFDSDVVSDLQEKLSDAGITNVSVVSKNETRSVRKATRYDASDTIITSMFEEMPDTITGGLEKNIVYHSYMSDSDWKVRVTNPNFIESRVLAKESDREDDDLYETLSEVPSLRFNIKMVAPSRGIIDKWTDEVIPQLHKMLSSFPSVGKVRYMACTVTEEKEGECYNL